MVSALADGADRVVADSVLASPGGRLEVVLPLSPEEYNRSSVHSVTRSPMFNIEAITTASKVRSSPEEERGSAV